MNDTPTRRPDMIKWALAYAERGTPVFPCAVAAKTPITANGFHDATTDPEQIRTWWTAHPDANIATPTGAPGFDVLDVDVRPDGAGWAALNRAKEAGLTDGWLRAIHTPSGGLHLHYPGTQQRNGTLRRLHLDFRGFGGYVLVPPSLGQTKTYSRRYELIRRQDDAVRPLDWAAVARLLIPAPAPRPFDSTQSRAQGADPTPWLAAHVSKQPEGNRNNALFWAACRAAEAGVTDYQQILDAAVHVGVPEHQAARTIRSARDTIGRGAPAAASGSALVPVPSTQSVTR